MPIAQKEYEGCTNYYDYLAKTFTSKKQRLCKILKAAPFKWTILEPEGGYFVCVDVTNAIPQIPIKYFYKAGKSEEKGTTEDWKSLENPDYSPDSAFSRFISYEYGVTPIPLSPMYDQSEVKNIKETRGGTFIRFAACKKDETLDKLEKLLVK